MLYKNTISIYRKPPHQEEIDYCLSFSGNGYIEINALTPFLDYNQDLYFEMYFKITFFPTSGFAYLMNSCYHKTDNKIGIAVDGNNLYVQINKGILGNVELIKSFSDNRSWHKIYVINRGGLFSGALDESFLNPNLTPVLNLPAALGFRIASDALNSENLNGLVDNILLTDTRDPIAQYLLNEGSGTIVNDSVSHYHGNIINGFWHIHI